MRSAGFSERVYSQRRLIFELHDRIARETIVPRFNTDSDYVIEVLAGAYFIARDIEELSREVVIGSPADLARHPKISLWGPDSTEDIERAFENPASINEDAHQSTA